MNEFLKLNLRCLYTKVLGRSSLIPLIYVDYLRSYNKILNLKNPDTIGAKIQWIKKYGNLERYTDLVDKYKVRDYVAKKIGNEYLPRIYGVFDNISQIEFEKLPHKFILKCNHCSGGIYVCKDKSKITQYEWNRAKKYLSNWLKFNYFHITGEKQYKNIERKILCEEYLEDNSGGLTDYEIFCIDGQPIYICVMLKTNTNKVTNDNFDLEWNKYNELNAIKEKESLLKIEKPDNLGEMLNVARILTKEFSFVRVDLRLVEGKIYFGELTFTSDNGTCPYKNIEKEKKIAKLINLRNYH